MAIFAIVLKVVIINLPLIFKPVYLTTTQTSLPGPCLSLIVNKKTKNSKTKLNKKSPAHCVELSDLIPSGHRQRP